MVRTRNRAHGVFVVAEMAMALVLLVGAGLMIRSVWQLLTRESGIRSAQRSGVQLSRSRADINFRTHKKSEPRTGELLERTRVDSRR